MIGGQACRSFPSIIRDARARKLPHQLWLFYSNNRPEDAAFLDELQQLAATTPTFHFVPTMTDMAKSSRPWDRDTGVIDQKMLSGRLSDLHGPIYYAAGPPAMVAAMREMLLKASVDEDDVRAEDFAGY